MTDQYILIIKFFIFGLISGVFYDIVRLSRVVLGIKHYSGIPANAFCKRITVNFKLPEFIKKRNRLLENSAVFIGDLLYSLTVGLAFIVYLYYTNNCIFRWYILLSSALGFTAYYFTLGKLVMLVSEWIVGILKMTVIYIMAIILIPVRFVAKYTWAFAVYLWNVSIMKILSKLKRRRAIKKTEQYAKNLKELLNVEI